MAMSSNLAVYELVTLLGSGWCKSGSRLSRYRFNWVTFRFKIESGLNKCINFFFF